MSSRFTQQARWYLHRLQGMTPAEVLWRLRGACQVQLDRVRVAASLYPSARRTVRHGATRDGAERFRVVHPPVVSPGTGVLPAAPPEWRDRLLARAGQIRRHRLTYFDLEACDHGEPFRWHRDHSLGKDAPVRFSPSIDYRDISVAGDCKRVWEPNRHHHLVVLGRAYRATGDRGYAEAAVEQLESWLDQNPFGKGMNWRSPLELGIRLINWVWALDLIRESGLPDGTLRERLLHSAWLHAWEIQRKYSRGSSANNHLVGEASGVFIAASCLGKLAVPDGWLRESRQILEQEILRQTYPEGCTREQAFGYHLFVTQFFLFSGLVARWSGSDFSEAYWRRLEKMVEFAGLLTEGGDCMPMVGDADDGYVLDLGPGGMDPHGIFGTAAVLFGRGDFRRWAGAFPEMASWLLGEAGRAPFDALDAGENAPLESRAFTDAGYYLLQCGDARSAERISVVFDCGELGYGSIAAHGHADALSICLRAFGTDILVDPGTYDYFTRPEWRSYLRSTRAHNTLTADGQDQSANLGPFLWGRRANVRCTDWAPSPEGGSVAGEHDGYSRLSQPLLHRRRVELRGGERLVGIRDEVASVGSHDLQLHFHFAEGCTCEGVGGNRFRVETGRGAIELEVDGRWSCKAVRGGKSPGPGWVSRGYHRKVEAPALVASARVEGPVVFEHRIAIGRPAK